MLRLPDEPGFTVNLALPLLTFPALLLASTQYTPASLTFNPLFDYAPTFIAAANSPLAAKPYIEAQDFADQTLITYPIDRGRSDIFTQLLTPARVEPKAVRQVELTAVILMLVASNRGVAVLPDWVLREVKYQPDYITKPVTEHGLPTRLYAATRSEDATQPFMAHFLRLARTEPVKLQRA